MATDSTPCFGRTLAGVPTWLTQTSPVTLQQDMAGIHDKLQAVNEVTEHRKAQCFGAWVV
jgi:hypothetical protein